jgi:hypothetical protein
MTKQQIKNAKILLRFMTTEPEVLERDLKKAGTLETTHYHDDYAWLMPVVEEIESLGYKVNSFGNTTSIHNEKGTSIVDHPHQETKIGSVYKAVVAFCEWYTGGAENEMIAKFMKATMDFDNEYDMFQVLPFIDNDEDTKHYYKPAEMLFESDWNWLMAAVRLLQDVEIEPDNNINITIGPTNYCRAFPSHGNAFEFIGEESSAIASVYKVVVALILMLNKTGYGSKK